MKHSLVLFILFHNFEVFLFRCDHCLRTVLGRLEIKQHAGLRHLIIIEIERGLDGAAVRHHLLQHLNAETLGVRACDVRSHHLCNVAPEVFALLLLHRLDQVPIILRSHRRDYSVTIVVDLA